MHTHNSTTARIGLSQITAMYIGAVLGSGILIIPGVAAEISGPASLLAWGLMTLVVLPMALTMGMLSAKFSHAGGVAHFVSIAFNARAGSLVGWYFAMAVVVGAPVLALTGSGYLCAALGLGDSLRVILAAIILAVGLLANYFGLRVTGRIQLAVVLITLIILIITIVGSLPLVTKANFVPFAPHGWSSIGSSAAILFWCFIGWEAVSNLSAEFLNPKRDAIVGTVIAAITICIIYFLTALTVIGTHSYGDHVSDASLVYVIRRTFGALGAVIAGVAALFICMAPAIAYIGATSRMICALAESGFAPHPLSRRSTRYDTPVLTLSLLACCFALLLTAFGTRVVTMGAIIQIPSATFILTYVGGSAAGAKLLKGENYGRLFSFVSLGVSVVILLFVKWSILYALVVTSLWFIYTQRSPAATSRNAR